MKFPRYIKGMLLSSDGNYVEGEIKGIASSPDVSRDLIKLITKKINSGLDDENFSDEHAYGFFSLTQDQFIACHFQLVKYTEKVPRGRPVFVDHLFISRSQLEQIRWDLLHLFQIFPPEIPLFKSVKTDLDSFEMGNSLQGALESFAIDETFANALVTELFGDIDQPVCITSAPNGVFVKLGIACGIYDYVPPQYAEKVSFITFGRPDKSTARIIFPTSVPRNCKILDWIAPLAQDKPGRGYAYWMSQNLGGEKKWLFREKINSLRLANDGRSMGACLDLAVEYDTWVSKSIDDITLDYPILIENINALNNFAPILTDYERGGLFTNIIISAVKLSKYETAWNVIDRNKDLLREANCLERLINHFVKEVFRKEGTPGIHTIGEFVLLGDKYLGSQNHTSLITFARKLVSSCLEEDKPELSIQLLLYIKNVSWLSSLQGSQTMIDLVPQLGNLQQFQFFIEKLIISYDSDLLVKLSALIKRSPKIQPVLRQTQLFLDNVIRPAEDNVLFLNYLESAKEMEIIHWLLIMTRYLLDKKRYIAISFLDKLSDDVGLARKLFAKACEEGDAKVSSLVGATLIKRQILLGNSDDINYQMNLPHLANANHVDAVSVFEIIQPILDKLTDDGIIYLINAYQGNPTYTMYPSIGDRVSILSNLLESRKRQRKIEKHVKLSIEKYATLNGVDIPGIISELLISYDYKSLAFLKGMLQKQKYLNIYYDIYSSCVAGLVSSDPLQLYEFSKSLKSASLYWEASIIVFRLLHDSYKLPFRNLSLDFAHSLLLLSTEVRTDEPPAEYIGKVVDLKQIRNDIKIFQKVCENIYYQDKELAETLIVRIENILDAQKPLPTWFFNLKTRLSGEDEYEIYIQFLKITLETLKRKYNRSL